MAAAPVGRSRRAVAAAVAAHRAAAARADRVDAAGGGPLVRQAWGLARLSALAMGLPVLGPLVVAAAARNTARIQRVIDGFPDVVEGALAGRPGVGPPGQAPWRVGRAPAGDRWLIASDLHRCVAGTVDWPGVQGTRRLYELALDHYAGSAWGLVENGDVEDFWLCGGSAYGAVYDLTRLAGHAARGAAGRELLDEVAAEHLRRIVANNPGVYDRIQDGFHAHGRYRRLVGNHDDVFLRPALVAALGEVHPGVEVLDALVLDDGGTGVGLVTHGHDLDAWNAPGRAGLGKLGTWLGSALVDAPVVGNPGVPDLDETAEIVDGRLPDRLTRVSRLLGANRDLYSLDEILLFEACRRRWAPEAALDLEEGPWLLLGHTHLPLHRPIDPASGGGWARYANSGAGIFAGCLTALEWDGSVDARHPSVRLVVWRHVRPGEAVDPGAVVAEDEGRPVVRQVLERAPGGRRLEVVGGGPVDSSPVGGGVVGAR